MLRYLLFIPLVLGTSAYGGSSNGAMWGAVIERTGNYATPGITTTPTTTWTRALGSAVQTTPTLFSGAVFVATNDATLYALSASDGTTLWQTSLPPPTHSTPAVDTMNGRLFIGTGQGLYAFEAMTGTFLWSFATTGPVISSPAVATSVVYISSTSGQILALDSATGTMLWETTFAKGFSSSSAIGLAESLVYATGVDGFVHALDLSTGDPVWSVSRTAPMLHSPALEGGVLFVADGLGRLLAFNATNGMIIWEQVSNSAFASSPSVAHGLVFVSQIPNTLTAVDPANGQEVWTFNAASTTFWTRAISTTDLVTAENAVYLATHTGTLYGLEPTTGAELWNFRTPTGAGFSCCPSLLDGELFIGDAAGVVYALSSP